MDYYIDLERSDLRDNNTLYVVRVLVLAVLVVLDFVPGTVSVVLDVLGVAVILDDAV